jgi:chromosome segregation ATPase
VGSRPRRSAAAQVDPGARRRLAAELREAERQVTEAEERLRAIEALLSDPSSYAGDLRALADEHAALRQLVDERTQRWAELAEQAEPSQAELSAARSSSGLVTGAWQT